MLVRNGWVAYESSVSVMRFYRSGKMALDSGLHLVFLQFFCNICEFMMYVLMFMQLVDFGLCDGDLIVLGVHAGNRGVK